MFAAIQDRENELRVLESQQAAIDAPLDDRLAVLPTSVRQQLEDAAGLLRDVPERAKTHFQALGIRFTLHPILKEVPRPFLRAEGHGDFERLAFRHFTDFTTTDRSDHRSIP